jgi:integrase
MAIIINFILQPWSGQVTPCLETKDGESLSVYAEKLATELEAAGQKRTAKAYRTAVRRLVEYNDRQDISLKHIDSVLIKGFEKRLKDDGKLPNTVSFYMRNIRAICNKAAGAGVLTLMEVEKPFANVYTGINRTMKTALPVGDLQKLRNIDFAESLKMKKQGSIAYARMENLYRSWRYFFFCFYARGMSFVDMAYLRKSSINGGIIRYCRRKTGQQLEIRITPELDALIRSFAKETAGSPYLFPVVRSGDEKARTQYENALRLQNMHLKRLAQMAGIKGIVSSHVARHTWASIGKRENVPLPVLSECLGHSSPATTMIYLASLDNSVLDAANRRVISALGRHTEYKTF